jgi:hypothetical protein
VKKPVWIGILLFAALMALIAYSTMGTSNYRVEVCMQFQGQMSCRTASGSSEAFALRTATSNACAGIASGVTDSIACEGSAPTKVTWLKR